MLPYRLPVDSAWQSMQDAKSGGGGVVFFFFFIIKNKKKKKKKKKKFLGFGNVYVFLLFFLL
jgi:hypothetical protein